MASPRWIFINLFSFRRKRNVRNRQVVCDVKATTGAKSVGDFFSKSLRHILLMGSAASGEGLVNVYRGTGKVLLVPGTKGFT